MEVDADYLIICLQLGAAIDANYPTTPGYDSLDPVKACRLLEQWGPVGAAVAALVILINQISG